MKIIVKKKRNIPSVIYSNIFIKCIRLTLTYQYLNLIHSNVNFWKKVTCLNFHKQGYGKTWIRYQAHRFSWSLSNKYCKITQINSPADKSPPTIKPALQLMLVMVNGLKICKAVITWTSQVCSDSIRSGMLYQLDTSYLSIIFGGTV